MSKTQTIKVPVALVTPSDDGDDDDKAYENAPLFNVAEEKAIAHVLVMRTDPDEGTLGTMPPTVTELDIKRRWGGGQFQLQARNEKNRPMKNGFRTLRIAGDPIFESESAQAKWKRQQGLDQKPPTDTIGVREIFALLSSTETKQKADSDRRAIELEAQHKRELERIRVESDMRAREREAEESRRQRVAEEREERRRKDDEERDERRRREAEEREERRRKDEEAARLRDREFQVTLAQLNRKGQTDGSDMLLKGMELAQRFAGGDGDGDSPVTAVAKALLPGVLDKFGGGKPTPAAAPGAAAAPSAESVTLDGTIGKKALQVIAHLQREGYDPEQAIEHALGMLMHVKRKTAPAPAAAAAAPSSPAPVETPVSKATKLEKPRTTKK